MFTGIIETTGTIRDLQRTGSGAAMVVVARGIAGDLRVGDSIAVNGVCLTATRCLEDAFCCDLSSETLGRTSFGRARQGTVVNLERALLVGSRMGGHFVQGHVDGMGTLVRTVPCGEGIRVTIKYPDFLERYIVVKGSIAVDGISLTIASLDGNLFDVAVIPHTLRETNIEMLRTGDQVNLEVDILAKYFERFFQLGLTTDRPSKLDLDYLKEQGF